VNIPYLLKTLNTKKLSELVGNIDLAPIDLNLAIWDAVANGEIKVNEEKDRVTPLVQPEASFDSELASKLLRVIQHYISNETNITRGRMNSLVKDPTSEVGYPWHEYLMAMQYLIDSEQVFEQEVAVPASGDRPYHKFVFLCMADNPNEDWNRASVNKWIADFAKKK
jgi:hypothetical protein